MFLPVPFSNRFGSCLFFGAVPSGATGDGIEDLCSEEVLLRIAKHMLIGTFAALTQSASNILYTSIELI